MDATYPTLERFGIMVYRDPEDETHKCRADDVVSQLNRVGYWPESLPVEIKLGEDVYAQRLEDALRGMR